MFAGKKYVDEQISKIRDEINETLTIHVTSIVLENDALKEQISSLTEKNRILNSESATYKVQIAQLQHRTNKMTRRPAWPI